MPLRPNVAKLKEVLLKAGVVDEFQMRAALGRLEQWGGRLTGVLSDMGFVDDETLVATLAQAFRVPVIHLGMVHRDATLLHKLDVAFCEEHGLFPVALKDRTATIAVSDPSELDTIDLLQQKLGLRVQVAIAPESEIRAAIARHYRGQDVPATRRTNNKARDAYIAATRGEVFELDDAPPPPPGSDPRAEFLRRPPSANTMLDEFLDEPKSDDFGPEALERLEAVKKNQLKTSAILRALHELLTEKGYR